MIRRLDPRRQTMAIDSALTRAKLHGPDRAVCWPQMGIDPDQAIARGTRIEVILICADGTTLGVDLPHAVDAFDGIEDDVRAWCFATPVGDWPAYELLSTHGFRPTFDEMTG